MIIIDTDVLIDAGRGVSEAVACLQVVEQQASLGVSIITEMELIVGCRNKAEYRCYLTLPHSPHNAVAG